MGYERGGRDGGRNEDDRQPRQDYDRSYGGRSAGERGEYGRADYGRSDQGRLDQGRSDPGRGDPGRADNQRRDETWQSRSDADRGRLDRGRDAYGARDDYRRSADRDDARRPQDHDQDDRGFIERAGDEVRSWFGDEEAERRRRLDERYAAREDDRDGDNRDRNERARDDRGSRGNGGGHAGTGAYGAGRSVEGSRGAQDDRQSFGHDTHYRSWRDRQMEQFDRDYEDYRREHQSKFESDFHGWRTNRQTQRDALGRVREHQEVVGSDGKHVGTVDKIRGDDVILTKQDQDAGGRHHSFPSAWIASVDEKVTISKTADDAHAHWRDAERTPAFWGDQSGRATGDANRSGGQDAARTAAQGTQQGAQGKAQPSADTKPGQTG